MLRDSWGEAVEDLGVAPVHTEQAEKDVTFVKIVRHDPTGWRVVGAMRDRRILFVGLATY